MISFVIRHIFSDGVGVLLTVVRGNRRLLCKTCQQGFFSIVIPEFPPIVGLLVSIVSTDLVKIHCIKELKSITF